MFVNLPAVAVRASAAGTPLDNQLALRQRRARQEQEAANALARLSRAEEQLREARASYSAAIEAQGLDTAGVFSACEFVRRGFSERRAAAAFEEGFAAGKRAARRDDGDDHETGDPDDPNDLGDDEPHDAPDEGKKKKVKEKADDDGDEDAAPRAVRALEALHPGNYAAAVKATAVAIVLAGKRARTGPGVELPPVGSMARQILHAGKKRRGGI